MPGVALCSFEGPGEFGLSPFSGGFGEGETPLPIPNRAVKPLSADGTWLARARESRTPPVYRESTDDGWSAHGRPTRRLRVRAGVVAPGTLHLRAVTARLDAVAARQGAPAVRAGDARVC